MSHCTCDYHKSMSNKENDVIAEDREEMKAETIHYDLEQTLREARRESGMSLRSIASVIKEVLDRDELNSLIEELNQINK